jgi:hypothetical protein
MNILFITDSGAGGHQQEGLIKRYHEIHFDYSTEFKNTSVKIYFSLCLPLIPQYTKCDIVLCELTTDVKLF